METPANGEARPGLTRAERAVALAAALLVFFFGAGPVWRHAWSPDASILWSYAVIPALVLVLLGRRGALRLGPFLSESLVLAIFKFGITAIVLIGFWSFSAPPAAVRAKERKRRVSLKGEEKEKEKEGEGEGERKISLKGEEGEGNARRAAPAPFTVAEIGGGKITPAAIHLVPSTPVAFRSSDGRLHALELLAADGSVRVNVPILASGVPRTLSFEEISLASSLRCAVHPEETAAVTR